MTTKNPAYRRDLTHYVCPRHNALRASKGSRWLLKRYRHTNWDAGFFVDLPRIAKIYAGRLIESDYGREGRTVWIPTESIVLQWLLAQKRGEFRVRRQPPFQVGHRNGPPYVKAGAIQAMILTDGDIAGLATGCPLLCCLLLLVEVNAPRSPQHG